VQTKVKKLISLLTAIFAVVVSVDIAPDAVEMLSARGKGDKAVWIADVYYSCVNGNSLAMVRNGKPEGAEEYSVVEAGGLSVYVPRSMSFEGDIPRIVTFPRKTGLRDVGVRNTLN
jgi:hypothetical protein